VSLERSVVMSASLIERIETEIGQLSLPDQLWLLERLAQRIRKRASPTSVKGDAQLAAMAHDPHIQRELREIEAEFALTEGDGLEVVG
jgi:hypothetical protein